MTPLRAAVLLALEQACRAKVKVRGFAPWQTDMDLVAAGTGVCVSLISFYVGYPGLVRASSIRVILAQERIAGHVLQDVTRKAHYWWPIGLADKLRGERQKEWLEDLARETEKYLAAGADQVGGRPAAEQLARDAVTCRRGPL